MKQQSIFPYLLPHQHFFFLFPEIPGQYTKTDFDPTPTPQTGTPQMGKAQLLSSLFIKRLFLLTVDSDESHLWLRSQIYPVLKIIVDVIQPYNYPPSPSQDQSSCRCNKSKFRLMLKICRSQSYKSVWLFVHINQES